MSLEGKTIAVLMGGPGAEREVSLASGRGVGKALAERGARVVPVDVTSPDFVIPEPVDIAFNIIHGTFGEDGDLQAILEDRGIPYTGEGVEGSWAAFDKIETKQRFIECGIPTADFEVIAADAMPSMRLPYVVKAPRQGSTVGVYIVKEEAEIAPAINGAAQYDQTLLIEEYIAGDELTVGVLGPRALPIILIKPKEGFYDFKNKYPFLSPQAGGGAQHYCPAPLPEKTTRLIQEIALAAHGALGLEIYSRVDFILSNDGAPYVLEINTIPGMTEVSLLPEAAAAAGISYGELCERIVDLSLARFNRRKLQRV
ncbi:MAG: D-alanine--D-alanine ligase [Chthoniobacteraceae bacterium]|jgi:D-alanine-D-alanine ligase